MNGHCYFARRRLGYAMRCLDAGEERAFERHLGTCLPCAAAVRRLERDLAWLGMAAPPARPDPAFVQRVLDHVIGSP
jgi:anti-sigma-K factor RskA